MGYTIYPPVAIGESVWRDKTGLLHYAIGEEVVPRQRLLWTACATGYPPPIDGPRGYDVPANAAWVKRNGDEVDCPNCIALQGTV